MKKKQTIKSLRKKTDKEVDKKSQELFKKYTKEFFAENQEKSIRYLIKKSLAEQLKESYNIGFAAGYEQAMKDQESRLRNLTKFDPEIEYEVDEQYGVSRIYQKRNL